MNSNIPWRTFSIFISSTFADMQAERDYLKHIVFPKVEDELRTKRIKLETVDLRWGVDSASVKEDERETTVLKVCLEEIKRCRPFFIGLLGDRYGWVPPEERLKIAMLGIEDLNSENLADKPVPQEKPEQKKSWLGFLKKDNPEPASDVRADKSGVVPAARKSVTALEIEFGVLASKEQLVRSVFYLREPLPYEKFSEKKAALFSDEFNKELSNAEKQERKAALAKLKIDIRQHFEDKKLSDKVKTYSGVWNEKTEKVTDLEAWGEMVYAGILAEIESHAKETWDQAPKNKHEQELALLEAFVEEHTHVTTVKTAEGTEQVPTFCGRKELIEELKQHLLSIRNENWGLALTGESGSGKSAVFAMMYKTMMDENCLVLAHSAGISPGAKSVAGLLQKWNRQLSDFLGIKEVEPEEIGGSNQLNLPDTDSLKTDPKLGIDKLQEQFAGLLNQAAAKTKVVLLIDALDRFEPTSRAQYMTWLPGVLPTGTRVLVTAITGTEKHAVQYHKGLMTKSIDRFTDTEAAEMLHSLCKKQHKKLPVTVEKAILEKGRTDMEKAASSPLWLSLAVNNLMAMDADDFEKISGQQGKGGEQIENYMLELAGKFPALPGDLFLNLVEKAAALFGNAFTRNLFNFIACSRNGLRESDLEMVLPKQTSETWDPLRFANLRRWFRMHLVEQGENHQWNLAHSILRGTLIEKINTLEAKIVHNAIALHFMGLPTADTLRVTETMYHLMQADNGETAANWYRRFWWNEPQTDGSSKVMAEAIIIDEVKGNGKWLEWVISLLNYRNAENSPSAISKSFLLSLFDKYFQNDITIQTRITLVKAAETRMEELRLWAPESAVYARDLAFSYYKIMSFSQSQGEQVEFLKYARLCKEALLYMKNSKMFMDEPLVNVLNSLEKY
jgi:hypothetical protein